MLWRKAILPALDALPDCEAVRIGRHLAKLHGTYAAGEAVITTDAISGEIARPERELGQQAPRQIEP